MSIQLHITKLCAPRTGSTVQPGPAGLAGAFGAAGGVEWMGFGPGREPALDGAGSLILAGAGAGPALAGTDVSFAADHSSFANFDYKTIDYNRIHCPWRSCFT